MPFCTSVIDVPSVYPKLEQQCRGAGHDGQRPPCGPQSDLAVWEPWPRNVMSRSAEKIRKCFEEQKLWCRLAHRAVNLTEKGPYTGLRIFAAAVLIQKESGGNLRRSAGRTWPRPRANGSG